MPVVELTGVSHQFGEASARRTVLADVNVRFSESRVGVVGANGSGKSTFARLLNGLIIPTQGDVTVDELSTARHGREIRRRVGFCFTDPDAQIVMPTVGEDVAFSLRSSDLTKEQVAERVAQVLGQFGLADLADRPSHLLSGGQKQLLALAAVLVSEPNLVVMDEPTTLLDMRNGRMIGEYVSSLETQVVLVTHHLELLDSFDRVLVFDEARLVCDDTPAAAIEHYRRLMG